MKPTFWQRLDFLARNLTPFGLTLVLVILSVVPLSVPGYARIAPLLAVMAVYHWTVYRPDLLPAFAVFLIGVLQDVLTAVPIGVNALVFLSVYGIVLTQRQFFASKPFFIVWLGFALIAGGAELMTWVLICIYHGTLLDPRTSAFQYLVNLGVFPALAWIFTRWQQAFLRLE